MHLKRKPGKFQVFKPGRALNNYREFMKQKFPVSIPFHPAQIQFQWHIILCRQGPARGILKHLISQTSDYPYNYQK